MLNRITADMFFLLGIGCHVIIISSLNVKSINIERYTEQDEGQEVLKRNIVLVTYSSHTHGVTLPMIQEPARPIKWGLNQLAFPS